MKSFICYIGIIISIIIITVVFLSYHRESAAAVQFLESFGWQVEPSPIESCEFTVPTTFDDVYENYNMLQKEAGLNLEPYKGRAAVRYTYTVKNYPGVTDGSVRANVVMISGAPVAGDICTVAIDGFMYSLNANSSKCYAVSK